MPAVASSQAGLGRSSDLPPTPSRKLRPRPASPRDSAACHDGEWQVSSTHVQESTLRSCLLYRAASRCVGTGVFS